MERATQSTVIEPAERETGPQVRLRLAVIDPAARPDADLPQQALSFAKTYPAPGEVGTCTVIRGTGNLTVENLLLARQTLRQAILHVEHSLSVEGHTVEAD